MSAEAIAFYLKKHVGTGSLGFYYDFSNYSGDHILSSSGGQYPIRTRYSGEIVGDMNNFTGNASGSGSFNNSYIKVSNIDTQSGDLIKQSSFNGFTFLISQEKIDNSCGTLFSNYAGLKTSSSGWEIGINNANRLYFKMQDAAAGGVPRNNILTLEDTPAAQNYYGIIVQSNYIYLARYLPASQEWTVASRQINPQYIRNNSDWYIGSGEYPYSGYMDKFAFFNEPLRLRDLRGIIDSSFKTVETGFGFSTKTHSGQLTGYHFYPTGQTGVIGQTGVLSGYTPVVTGSGNYISGQPLIGIATGGMIYYEAYSPTTFSGGFTTPKRTIESYSGVRAREPEILPGKITGFHTGFSGFTQLASGAVYITSGITGVTTTGSGASGLYGPNTTHVLNSGIDYLSGEFRGNYLYNAATYLNQRSAAYNINDGTTGDYIEVISNVPDAHTNFIASYGFSPAAKASAKFLTNSQRNKSGEINLFANGLFQASGERVAVGLNTADRNSPNTILKRVESGNYVLDGISIISGSTQFVGSDQVMYDDNQTGIRERLNIFNTGNYAASPFSEITLENTQIFFNGQKIYSGLDYIDNGGFSPTGTITGITGTYCSIPAYSGASVTSTTGMNYYDITGVINNQGGLGFSGDPLVFYVNGIRNRGGEDFIYYSTGVSLLTTGKNVMELPIKNAYNINISDTTFF